MGKLLAWGDTLFLVRYELGKLQIQRVSVDAEGKKASLSPCNVNSDSEAAALPADARLIAAKEVEDIDLAIRYPVLIFRASRTDVTVNSSPVSRKRRRSKKDKETNTPLASSRSDRLFFCILHETERDNEIGLRLLNALEVPKTAGDGVDNPNSLLVFLTDGPHVLLFERCSQLATLLKLQRARQADSDFGFYVWREQVDVIHDVKDDTPASFEVVSCTYVSEMHSTRPHMLIHAQRSSTSSSADSERHTWSIVEFDYEGQDRDSKEISSKCHYLPSFTSATGDSGALSVLEQVTCCCFISELSEWDFTASSFSETTTCQFWNQGLRTPRCRTNIDVSTLMITGTTSNTVHVHANGILLVSYVLPTRPMEMWFMCDDSLDQHHVLCVRCDDVNRSFFMLGFSSAVQNVSMDLLLSFNHVGHVYTGNFAGMHATGTLASTQVLLLNDVPGIVDISNSKIGDEVGTNGILDDGQLVKRSVLVTQKTSTPEIKLSCHRLRLREQKGSKHGSRSRKRSRNDEKVSSKDGPTGLKPEPFRYIERTQKALSRDRNMYHFDNDADDTANALAASHAQLGRLTDSLSTRLSDGLKELKRLQMIVSDKHSLTSQLNQLIVRQLQTQQARANLGNEHSLASSLLTTHEMGNLRSSFVDMETIVSALPRNTTIPRNDAKDEPTEQVSDSLLGDLKPNLQVSLEQLRVFEYIPSASLVRAEVVLINVSETTLHDSFVGLTAPNKGLAQGWKCSCPVIPKFYPTLDLTTKQPRYTRFQLELHFAPNFSFLRERKPLEAVLWLHWGASGDDLPSSITFDWRPSESAVAVASIKIYPKDVLDVSRESLTTDRGICCDEGVSTEQEQLLFISSGSNLRSWFGKPNIAMPTSVSSIIRPSFALVSLNVRSQELMLHELSKMTANLPLDMYVMHYPFQHTHLRAVQRVLYLMRQEINSRNSLLVTKEKLGTRAKHKKQTMKSENRDPASIYRAMQRNTDLQVSQLLQGLQKRVNFHTMWFDVTTVETHSSVSV